MAEKYPSFSGYSYTLQNPVRFIDPTGMVVETPDNDYGYDKKTGKLTLIKETSDKYDKIFAGEFTKDGSFHKNGESIKIDKGALFGGKNDDLSKEGIIFRNLEDGLKTMKFLSFSGNREFSGWAYKDSEKNKVFS